MRYAAEKGIIHPIPLSACHSWFNANVNKHTEKKGEGVGGEKRAIVVLESANSACIPEVDSRDNYSTCEHHQSQHKRTSLPFLLEFKRCGIRHGSGQTAERRG